MCEYLWNNEGRSEKTIQRYNKLKKPKFRVISSTSKYPSFVVFTAESNLSKQRADLKAALFQIKKYFGTAAVSAM